MEDKERKGLPYEKPILRTIELRAEEVLVVGCKLDSGGFNVGATPCTFASCVSAGT